MVYISDVLRLIYRGGRASIERDLFCTECGNEVHEIENRRDYASDAWCLDFKCAGPCGTHRFFWSSDCDRQGFDDYGEAIAFLTDGRFRMRLPRRQHTRRPALFDIETRIDVRRYEREFRDLEAAQNIYSRDDLVDSMDVSLSNHRLWAMFTSAAAAAGHVPSGIIFDDPPDSPKAEPTPPVMKPKRRKILLEDEPWCDACGSGNDQGTHHAMDCADHPGVEWGKEKTT